jgi:hypothetical protein
VGVSLCAASGKVPAGTCARSGKHTGDAVQYRRETLTAACQVAGVGAAGLLLPSYVIDGAFDTDLLSIMSQAMLAAFACALILAVWTDHQEQLDTDGKRPRRIS